MAYFSTPPPAPDRTDPATFASRATDSLNHWITMASEGNDFATDMNKIKNDTNTIKNAAQSAANSAESSKSSAASSAAVALAAANYKGAWAANTYTVPSSVTHLNALWVLNAAAVSTDIPGTSDKWTFWSLDEYPIPVNPSLDLDFGNQTYRSYVDHLGLTSWPLVGTGSKITFARSGTGGGTYFDAMGVMQQAGENEPRIDCDPVTGECLGLLVEEQRTNLLTYSEDFRDTTDAGATRPWEYVNASLTINAAVAPDGTTTMDKIVPTTGAGLKYIRCGSSVTIDVTYTFSVFISKDTDFDFFWIGGASATWGSGAISYYNLSTGVVSFQGPGVVDADIIDCGNHWRLINVIKAVSTASSITNHTFGPCDASGSQTATGDGTSGLYVWGAQLEAGAFPTSYIPTISAAVTRNADLCSITGTNFSEWYRQGVGTVVCECRTGPGKPSAVTVRRLYEFGNGTVNNRINGNYRQHDAHFQHFIQGGASVFTAVNSMPAGTDFSVAVAFRSGNHAIVLNGANALTATNTVMPTNLTQLLIGNWYSGTLQFCGHIRKLQYWPTRLGNTTLQALTRG